MIPRGVQSFEIGRQFAEEAGCGIEIDWHHQPLIIGKPGFARIVEHPPDHRQQGPGRLVERVDAGDAERMRLRLLRIARRDQHVRQMVKSGGRWVDAPACSGPRRTLYNHFVRWAAQGIWQSCS